MRSLTFLSLLLPLVSVFAEPEQKFFESPVIMPQEKKLFFLHIPKCGGTSAAKLFEEAYGLQNQFLQGFDPSSSNNNQILTQLCDFLKTDTTCNYASHHISFFHLNELSEKVDLITFLRDPIKRQISQRKHWSHISLTSPDAVKQWRTLNLGSDYTSNLQTLYLTSFDPESSEINMEDHLESAKYNLKNKIKFFGFTEELELSLNLFFKSLGIHTPFEMPFENTASTRPESDISFDEEKLRQENWADIELYKFAKELFYERFPHLKH
jgi:hypothetical protein